MAQFATSARAVDMLGRQQIASVPTAISELFKNSYDAYATQVRADYFREARALLLRDDGVGMSGTDFLERWLVLGTDSKAADSSRRPPPRPKSAALRPTMGEKGIGRLAIASIGPQVLVVTRPDRGAPRQTTVALVQWTMFEIPGLVLNDVEVPMVEIDDPWPSPALLESLTAQLRKNLKDLGKRVPTSFRTRVLEELDALEATPIDPESLGGPTLGRSGNGTGFLVAPVRDELDAAMSQTTMEQETNRSTDFERLLIGFTNTMLPTAGPPAMKAAFVVHDSDEANGDLIAPKAFWSPEDLALVDHDIEGTFDEFGRFQGSVSIYGRPPADHTVLPPRNVAQTVRCGPFHIRIGYLQGDPKESLLDPHDYATTQAKLARIGGLYVYRDGIRVLPYGSANVDYLNIEERRSRNAGRYYFSYRRMFGAIEISSADNPRLRDKASREGLLENAAFRDFKALLENFFVQTAADFFRAGGKSASDFESDRSRLRDEEKARHAASERLARRRRAYVDELQQRLDRLEGGQARRELSDLIDAAERRIEEVSDVAELASIERGCRDAVARLVAALRLRNEPDLALEDDERRDLEAFRSREQEFRSADVVDALGRLAELVDGATSRDSADQVAQARVAGFVNEAESVLEGVRSSASSTEQELGEVSERVRQRVLERVRIAQETVDQLVDQLSESISTDTELEALERVHETAFEQEQELERLRGRLQTVLDDDSAADARLIQERLIRLEAQSDADIDLLLMGQAVQVIDHELEQTVGAARNALSRLRSRTRASNLRSEVDEASAAFEHLDGYLRLFTPLQRRLRRQRTEVDGSRIAVFLDSLMAERLRRHGVKLRATRPFRTSSMFGFPSTFLPVFVNIVDNAIYWVGENHPNGGGEVILDFEDGDFLVRDNGTGVREQDIDVIFSSGFSRRPGGRGLGLSISRDALRREGWTLSVDPPSRVGEGATFRMHNEVVEREGQ